MSDSVSIPIRFDPIRFRSDSIRFRAVAPRTASEIAAPLHACEVPHDPVRRPHQPGAQRPRLVLRVAAPPGGARGRRWGALEVLKPAWVAALGAPALPCAALGAANVPPDANVA